MTTYTFAQDREYKSNLELNTILNIDEVEYGLQAGYNHQILKHKKGWYSLNIGGYEEYFIQGETVLEESTKGNTLSNQLGISITNQFNILKNRKVYLINTFYAGWGFRRTKVNLINETYSINASYNKSYNFLAIGMYWKAGYMINEKWGIQANIKTDLSRLVDQYRPVLLEKPGLMYGIGFIYKF